MLRLTFKLSKGFWRQVENQEQTLCRSGVDDLFILPMYVRTIDVVLHKRKPRHDNYVGLNLNGGINVNGGIIDFKNNEWIPLGRDAYHKMRSLYRLGYRFATIQYDSLGD